MDAGSLDWWFTSPSDPPDNAFLVLTIALGVIFVASAIVYWRRAKIAPDNPVLRRFLRRVSKSGMWIAGIGLFLALMRYTEVDYLSIPALMLALVIAAIITIGYYVYDLSEHYPLAVHKLQESHIERRYRPPAGKRQPEPVRVRSGKMRGKRRR